MFVIAIHIYIYIYGRFHELVNTAVSLYHPPVRFKGNTVWFAVFLLQNLLLTKSSPSQCLSQAWCRLQKASGGPGEQNQ